MRTLIGGLCIIIAIIVIGYVLHDDLKPGLKHLFLKLHDVFHKLIVNIKEIGTKIITYVKSLFKKK